MIKIKTLEEANDMKKDQIIQIHNDKEFDLMGVVFSFPKISFFTRRKVFAYYTKISKDLEAGDFSAIDTKEFNEVMGFIEKCVLADDEVLSSKSDFWIGKEELYIPFIFLIFSVFSIPFLGASPTD